MANEQHEFPILQPASLKELTWTTALSANGLSWVDLPKMDIVFLRMLNQQQTHMPKGLLDFVNSGSLLSWTEPGTLYERYKWTYLDRKPYRSQIMVLLPDTVKVALCYCIGSLLEIKLQPTHATPTIFKLGMIFLYNSNSPEGLNFLNIRDSQSPLQQIHSVKSWSKLTGEPVKETLIANRFTRPTHLSNFVKHSFTCVFSINYGAKKSLEQKPFLRLDCAV